jgi:hypothetical protein
MRNEQEWAYEYISLVSSIFAAGDWHGSVAQSCLIFYIHGSMNLGKFEIHLLYSWPKILDPHMIAVSLNDKQC